MAMPPMPASVLNAGTPEGTPASMSLAEDAWDLLGLGVTEATSDRDLHVKNGQVCLLTSADYASAKKKHESDQRAGYRQQWQANANSRVSQMEAKKDGLASAAAETGIMKTQKFTWSKDAKSFEWRKIYHALVGNVGQDPVSQGILAEAVITPTSMRMYTDHRVMGNVVLPGVSHVSLMAATASMGMPSPGGMGEWHISVKETLFERPYIVHSGAELIAAIANGQDPATVQGMAGVMPLPVAGLGVPVTYCRASNVSKEKGMIKPEMDWTK
eukprot:TRINITY_DN36280_c0_g1_i1.p1 TRINITY_DN36280_c0_g1~~TRINITY_DN36280_c0_g1_i1.p1  ORF type:complete len:271 (+),score=63.01 TRINITY_DN36280_c0_g1_i1:67-879(+)